MTVIDASFARSGLARLYDDEPAYAGTALFLAALALPTGAAHLLDARTIDGVSVWSKPLKFELALFVYAATLAFYARFVPEYVRRGRVWRGGAGVAVASILLEMAWMISAAALGERAHFNFTHPVLAWVYPAMGVFAGILTAATTQYAWAIHRHAQGLAPALKAGLVWGLGLTLPLTLVTTGVLTMGVGHHVEPGALFGATGPNEGGLPVLGWGRTGGDLRVTHFFATHALHGVPAIALACFAARWRSIWAARAAALAWTALAVFTLAQGLAGRPFLSWIG